jgi:hypothetical protein
VTRKLSVSCAFFVRRFSQVSQAGLVFMDVFGKLQSSG